jgi:hypothetical protein
MPVPALAVAAPTRPRRARRTAVAVLALALGAAATVGCSGSSTPADRSDAEDAAATISGIFQLTPDEQTCLKDGLDGDGKALAVVGATDEPSAADQAALASVLDACVTVDQFAAGFAARIAAALPPTGTVDGATQVRCVTEQVKALDDTRRHTLFVGLVAITAPPTGPLALARGEVVNGITDACGLQVQP